MKGNGAKKTRSEKGFTLVEVIISIGFLCLACGIIIQLFVASGDIREKTTLKETASVIASNTVEACRISNSPTDVGIGIFNQDSTVYTMEEGKYSIRQYFSEYWLPPSDSEDPFYVVKTIIEQVESLSEQDDVSAGLYSITVTVELINVNRADAEIIIELNTQKYYVFREDGDAE